MSLLLLEGFDAADFAERMSAITTPTNTAAGRTGANARNYNGTNTASTWAFASHATIICGMAFANVAPLGGSAISPIMVFREEAISHITVEIGATGRVRILRGTGAGTLLGETSPNVITLTATVWHYIEVFVTVGDAAGVVKLRVDGKIPPGWSDLAAVDTRNAGTGVIDTIKTIGTGSVTWKQDDLYIANGDATAPNDVIGDVRVHTLFPNGNGNYSQLAGSDGNSVDNYLLVDEAIPSVADYVGSPTDGLIDTYLFQDLGPVAGSVHGVQVSMFAFKSDAAAKSIRAIVRRGADVAGADKTLQVSGDAHDQIWTLDPVAVAAWTIANLNASEFGAEVRP